MLRLRDPETGGEVLRVPVAVDGRLGADLVLADPEGGSFSDTDVEGMSVLGRVTGVALRNAWTYALSERRREAAELTARMDESVRAPATLLGPVTALAEGARQVARAELAAVVRIADGRVDVATSCGDGTASLPDVLTRLDAELQTAQQDGETFELDLPGTDGVVVRGVPLRPEHAFEGVVLLVLRRDRGRFSSEDRALLESLVSHGSLVLDHAVLQQERQQAVVAADRGRIARDLHDLVIQRLFATGLKLKTTRRTAGSGHEYVDAAVGDLDTTIRDIRSTIYELERGGTSSLRGEIAALAREYAPVLGFTPLVRTWGPLESMVGRDLAEQATAVLREALSNCARHAEASGCRVEVSALTGWLSVEVVDDGAGPGAGSGDGHGSGLRNLGRRAEELGGALTVEADEPTGTRLLWRVPLDQATGSSSGTGTSGDVDATGAAARGQTSSEASESSTQQAPVTSR